MRWSLWIVGALAALCALSSAGVRAQEHGEGEGGTPDAEITAMACSSSVKTLEEEVHTLFEEYSTIINCFAFGSDRNLEHGVVSVFKNNGTPVARYSLTCGRNTIKAERLEGQNTSDMENTACLECRPTSEDEICYQPCSSECEKCALIGGVSRCTECHRYRLLNSYPPRIPPTAEQIEREREGAGEEEVCEDDPMPDPENPLDFRCVEECSSFGNHFEVNEEKKTCFACGLEYCVECEESEEPNGRDECVVCMTDTILFEGECFACPLATIARTAIVQEAEEQAEERANQLRQIELAVALPVVCFLVIVFFLAMSVYAHHRYPHISHKGHKRHRKKTQDMFSREASSPSPAPTAEEELPPLAESGVWRSRPTIRFR